LWKIRGILPSYAVAAAVLFQAQLICNLLLDNCTLEEARLVARVQHGGIGEA
jgi:hypothetical protein